MPPVELEIPAPVRKMAEEGVRMSLDAYGHLAAAIQQADNLVKTSPALMGSAIKDLQALCLRFSKDNARASFDYAAELANAKTAAEWFEINTTYASDQAALYMKQSRELAEWVQRIGTA